MSASINQSILTGAESISISSSKSSKSSKSGSTQSSGTNTPNSSAPSTSANSNKDTVTTPSATQGVSPSQLTSALINLQKPGAFASNKSPSAQAVLAMSAFLAKSGLPEFLSEIASGNVISAVKGAVLGAAVGIKNAVQKAVSAAVAALVSAAIAVKSLFVPAKKPTFAEYLASKQVDELTQEANVIVDELNKNSAAVAAGKVSTPVELEVEAYLNERLGKLNSLIDLQSGFVNSKFDGQAILDEVNAKLDAIK